MHIGQHRSLRYFTARFGRTECASRDKIETQALKTLKSWDDNARRFKYLQHRHLSLKAT